MPRAWHLISKRNPYTIPSKRNPYTVPSRLVDHPTDAAPRVRRGSSAFAVGMAEICDEKKSARPFISAMGDSSAASQSLIVRSADPDATSLSFGETDNVLMSFECACRHHCSRAKRARWAAGGGRRAAGDWCSRVQGKSGQVRAGRQGSRRAAGQNKAGAGPRQGSKAGAGPRYLRSDGAFEARRFLWSVRSVGQRGWHLQFCFRAPMTISLDVATF